MADSPLDIKKNDWAIITNAVITSKFKKNFSCTFFLMSVNLILLFLVIYFGLFYKGLPLNNNVRWLENKNGIRLGHYSIVYSDMVFPSEAYDHGLKDLSFELAVRPDNIKNDRFKILLSIHGGIDNQQLLFGQWRSSLIVMNGDDYDGKLGIPKVGVANALPPDQNTFINVTSGMEGTRVYINGELKQFNSRLVLKIPNKQSKPVVVLGNSPYGRHSWTGDIYGLAIYEQILNEKTVSSHNRQWLTNNSFLFPRDVHSKSLFAFDDKISDDKAAQRVFDHSLNAYHLIIPKRVEILKKEILVAPWNEKHLDHQLAQDMLINLGGFISPGFFLFALLVNLGGWFKKHGILLTLWTCFGLSITIELIQGWIPSRSSQSLDLIMNTMGAFTGILFYFIFQLLFKRFQLLRKVH